MDLGEPNTCQESSLLPLKSLKQMFPYNSTFLENWNVGFVGPKISKFIHKKVDLKSFKWLEDYLIRFKPPISQILDTNQSSNTK